MNIENKNLGHILKKQAVEKSFRNKLAELYAIVRKKKRNPSRDIWFPTTLKEFRDWEKDGKFGKWKSKSIDAPGGKYPELAKKLALALAELNADPVKAIQLKVLELESQLRVLVLQNATLESQIRSLIDDKVLNGEAPINGRTHVIQLYRGQGID